MNYECRRVAKTKMKSAKTYIYITALSLREAR